MADGISTIDAIRRQGARVAHGVAVRARERADNSADTLRALRAAARRYDSNMASMAARAARLFRERGFSPEESFTEGLLDPAADEAHMRATVSKREIIREQSRLNPNALSYLTEDKVVFSLRAESLGLPVPRLHAVFTRVGTGWSRDGGVLATPDSWDEELEHGLPDTYVLKPARGYHGLDVTVVERRDGGLVALPDEPVTGAELRARMVGTRRFHAYLAQERLENHPDMPGDRRGLQTARIVTLVGRDGESRILASTIRLVAGDGMIDNFRHGRTGNMLSTIDLETGTLGPVLGAGPDGLREPVAAPPGALAHVEGTRLPLWDEVRATVIAAAPLFPPMRCLGWDIAITPRGPMIVETNIWWDPPGGWEGMESLYDAMRAG